MIDFLKRTPQRYLRGVGALLGVVVSTSLSWGVTLDPERVISLTIADQGLTRLSMTNDTIQDIFVHPAEASHRIQLHQSGHVFVTPEGLTGPLSVTVITERGVIQDLRLRAVSQKPAPIYLEERRPVPPPLSLESPKTPDEILADFVFKGGSPGFQSFPLTGVTRQVEGRLFQEQGVWRKGPYQVTLFQGDGSTVSLAAAKRAGDLVLAGGLSTDRPTFFVIQSLT